MLDTSNAATATRTKSKIMLVDDHPLVREGFAALISLEPDLEVCCVAAGATEALELLRKTVPDLVIVDLFLNDGNGIELIKQIRASHPSIQILVASMHDDAVYAERVMRAGAMGYINKQEAGSDMIAAIRQVLQKKVFLGQIISQQILRRQRTDSEKSMVDALSDRELEIFELIGNGHSSKEIADRLHLSIKTIESHRENIKAKLGFASSPELVKRALEWVLHENSGHANMATATAPTPAEA